MCQTDGDALWKYLEVYLQECAKFELHYSAVRSGVVTFLLLITVTFGTQSALRVDSAGAAAAAGAGVALLLLFAYFFGVHFQRNTKAARFAQEWVGRTLAAHYKNPADASAKVQACMILEHQAPAELIRNFVDRTPSPGKTIPALPEGAKKARRYYWELISAMTFLGGILIFAVFVAMLYHRVSDSPGPYVFTKDERAFQFDSGILVSGDWTEIILLERGVREVTVKSPPHAPVQSICVGATKRAASSCWD